MKKERSPNYPSMNLEEAIEMLRTFHESSKGYPIDASDDKPDAFKLIGFDKPHGDAKRALAALVTYGLLENGAGPTRTVKTSDAGRKIATYPADDPNRPAWYKVAGLKPKVYASLVAKFPHGLPPSDSPITSYLLGEGFNPSVTASVIKDFKATAAFADLFGDGTLQVDEEQEPDPEIKAPPGTGGQPKHKDPPPPKTELEVPPGMKALAIPIGPEADVIIHYPANLSPEDLEFVKQQLDTYKLRITVPIPPPPSVPTGPAFWRSKDHDQPVVVTGYAGFYSGRHFAHVQDSTTGIPLDELVWDDDE